MTQDTDKLLENERTLNRMLRTVSEGKPLDETLLNCLDILLGVSWCSLLPKGGVFLSNQERDELMMVCQRSLSPELLTLCAKVPFGRCLCGRAAASKQIQHANCVDHRHEITFEGIKPHGHYNIPIMDGEEVTGVIVLYLPHGYQSSKEETEFLTSAAQIFSLVIKMKRIETERDLYRDRVEQYEAIEQVF